MDRGELDQDMGTTPGSNGFAIANGLLEWEIDQPLAEV
jgi:hypothetical protein